MQDTTCPSTWPAFDGALAKNFIWQECLEMTITGANAPLHHMIHDGRYITMDKLGPQLGGGDAAWKAIIARPTAMEASYGATSTSVFYVDGTVPGYENELGGDESIEVAIRFVGSDGKFYFQQNATHLGPGSAGHGERPRIRTERHPAMRSSLRPTELVLRGQSVRWGGSNGVQRPRAAAGVIVATRRLTPRHRWALTILATVLPRGNAMKRMEKGMKLTTLLMVRLNLIILMKTAQMKVTKVPQLLLQSEQQLLL